MSRWLGVGRVTGCMVRKTWRIGSLRAGLALGLTVILMAPAAQAQMMGGAGGMGAGQLLSGGKARGSTPAPAPPSALPGARPGEKVAPAEVSPSSMNPTAALFDAINRDDLAAARDALNRGAELRGRNVLGMTPLQLSIDLGRNDITFLLLSMRAADDTGPPAGPGIAASGGPGAPPARRATAADHARIARQARRAAAPSVRVAAAPAPAPARFAGNGGTPVPGAGFLGFDPGR